MKLIDVDNEDPTLFDKIDKKFKTNVNIATKQIHLLDYLMSDEFKKIIKNMKKIRINKLDYETINIIQRQIINIKNNQREKLSKQYKNKLNNKSNNNKSPHHKKMKENKEKVMQKYITFYWNRKSRLDKKKKFFLHFNEKYDEKFNKLEEIEKAEEDKKKKLIKKLLKIETNQKEFLNKEKLKHENIKKQRLKYYNTCRNIKHDLERNLTEEANDILDYQNCVLSSKKHKIQTK